MKPSLEQIFKTQPQKQSLDEIFSIEKPKIGLVEGIKSDFKGRVDKSVLAQEKSISGEQSLGSGTLQTVGQGAGFVGDVLMQGLKAIIPDPVEDVISKGVQKVAQTKPVQDIATRYSDWASQNPEASANLEATLNLASIIPAGKGITKGTEIIGNGVKKTGNVIADVTQNAKKYPKEIFEKVSESVTPLDPKVKNILQTTSLDKFDEIVNTGKAAMENPRLPTPFETTGEKLAESAKQLRGKLQEIGKQKAAIIEPLNSGLQPFRKETKSFIEKLNSFKNTFGEIDASQKGVVQSIINDAKTVSTKLDADRLIDKVQDAIYTGNTNQTIVGGSSLDKQLRGIIGEYNSQLKKTLPPEYSILNDKYSKLSDNLSVLNRSLGETIEGVPIRGASLIKQFFSPAGTKSKEIFKVIKDELGIDLAEDATLSKFVMETLGDTRATSLLEQIPLSKGGAIIKTAETIKRKLTRPIEKARKTIEKRPQ